MKKLLLSLGALSAVVAPVAAVVACGSTSTDTDKLIAQAKTALIATINTKDVTDAQKTALIAEVNAVTKVDGFTAINAKVNNLAAKFSFVDTYTDKAQVLANLAHFKPVTGKITQAQIDAAIAKVTAVTTVSKDTMKDATKDFFALVDAALNPTAFADAKTRVYHLGEIIDGGAKHWTAGQLVKGDGSLGFHGFFGFIKHVNDSNDIADLPGAGAKVVFQYEGKKATYVVDAAFVKSMKDIAAKVTDKNALAQNPITAAQGVVATKTPQQQAVKLLLDKLVAATGSEITQPIANEFMTKVVNPYHSAGKPVVAGATKDLTVGDQNAWHHAFSGTGSLSVKVGDTIQINAVKHIVTTDDITALTPLNHMSNADVFMAKVITIVYGTTSSNNAEEKDFVTKTLKNLKGSGYTTTTQALEDLLNNL